MKNYIIAGLVIVALYMIVTGIQKGIASQTETQSEIRRKRESAIRAATSPLPVPGSEIVQKQPATTQDTVNAYPSFEDVPQYKPGK